MSKEISRSALSSSVIVARISADPTMFDHPKRIKRRLALLFCIALASPLLAESPMRSNTVETTLRIPASRFSNSSLEQLPIDLRTGIGPDDAAAIALYSNPALRSIRDRRGLASAQLIQAGILPNPVVSYSRDYVTGGNTAGTVTAYNFTAAWEFSALIPFLPKQTAARKNYRSVDLDVAWDEWQIAVNARTAVYRVLGLNAQLAQAVEATEGLQQSTDAMRKAVDAHEKTVLELAAVESASQDSRATMLALEQEFHKQGLGLNKILGVEAEVKVALRAGLSLPTRLAPPEQHELADDLQSRRLDLLGLQQGLESQDATVRAAILAQFPKMSAGFVKASDTTNVHTTGFIVAVDVPIFDRNQGVIATERATRQRLRDEYTQRAFEARSDIAVALADIRSLDRQITAAQEALPLLEKLVSSAQAATEQRNADVLSYYTARSNLLQKRVQLIKLQEQLLEAHTALEIASGRYLPMNKVLQVR
ncbi:MAG TPA: TolC family protein [Chthoniobacterales bacterium]|nr:TolC family protein [Chthoniobacterales bacterium]